MEKTVNITLKVQDFNVNELDNALRSRFNVIDFKILPNTEKLYSEDEHFKKLVKSKMSAARLVDKYINDHNYK